MGRSGRAALALALAWAAVSPASAGLGLNRASDAAARPAALRAIAIRHRPLTRRAPADRGRIERPAIVNGLLTGDFPSVGALLEPGSASSGATSCSGTMIGCETFLTAAHCVCPADGASCQPGGAAEPDPGAFVVFLQHAGFRAVASIAVHPDFSFPNADVAVLKLAQPVTGIRPTPINTTGRPPTGSSATIVGFGRAGGGLQDYGLKRHGRVLVDLQGCDPDQVCWRFESPLGPPGQDSNTCNADSGGPLLWDPGSGEVVAGITSGGTSAQCLPLDLSSDADVFTYRTFIATEAGADLGAPFCGAIAQVGDAAAHVDAITGSLGSSTTSQAFTVPVGPAVTSLRVALNASEQGGADFDLYVKSGGPPSPADFDCKADGPNQFGYCELLAPLADTVDVLVQRVAGSAAFQLTVTALSDSCGPGSDGSVCDDGNPCTTGDQCQGEICVGAPSPDGLTCDDGDGCTWGDACQAGTCVGSATPRPSCREPIATGASSLVVKDFGDDRRDLLRWSWRRGAATSKMELGEGTTGAGFDLCLWRGAPGAETLAARLHVPAGGGWTESGSGYRYRDPSAASDGIQSVRLHAGASDGKARIALKAKGLSLPAPALPLAAGGPVTVQLAGPSACWEARFTSPARDDLAVFRSRSE